MAERRLGRGLDFFLSSKTEAKEPTGESPPIPVPDQEVAVEDLVPNPHQPRTEFSEADLDSLTASIKTSGVLQPVLCRRVGDRLQIVAGERRWRAAKKAGLTKIPAVIRDLTDHESAVFALVENLQRANLNPIEKAEAFRKIQQETGTTQEALAKQVGLDRSTVANLMRLLELPPEVRTHVANGRLTMGHARALLATKSAEDRSRLAAQAIREEWNVRQTEAAARGEGGASEAAPQGSEGSGSKAKPPAWQRELQDDLGQALDAKVGVKVGGKRSKITIECVGREEFERVAALLKSLRAR